MIVEIDQHSPRPRIPTMLGYQSELAGQKRKNTHDLRLKQLLSLRSFSVSPCVASAMIGMPDAEREQLTFVQ